jgi:hypothetical protein
MRNVFCGETSARNYIESRIARKADARLEATFGELNWDLRKCAGKSRNDRMGLIFLIVVILLLVGAFPTGGYGFGYRSHGIIGTILVILLILYLLGRL